MKMFLFKQSKEKEKVNEDIKIYQDYLMEYWKITKGLDKEAPGTSNIIKIFDFVQLKPYPFLLKEYGGCTSSLETEDDEKLYAYVLNIDKKSIDPNKVVPLYNNIDMRVAYVNKGGKISTCRCDSRLFHVVVKKVSPILQEFVNDNPGYYDGNFKSLVESSMIRPRAHIELHSRGEIGKYSSYKSEVFYPRLLVMNEVVVSNDTGQKYLQIPSVTLVGMLPSGKLEEITVERDLICKL
jgi:hypothetical protein